MGQVSLKIFLVGATGRMGREIALALERHNSSGGGDTVVKEIESANVIIDFSSPMATVKTLELAATHHLPVLIGTTGIPPELDEKFASTARTVPVIRAANTSVGVNVMQRLVAEAAAKLGSSFDISMTETHHRAKKDAPSGTALLLARAMGPKDIPIQSIRGGDVAGEHTVFFLGAGERLEITHRATSRAVFAEGALRAARWLVTRVNVPGLYTMADVL